MPRLALILPALILAAPAAALQTDWSRAAPVEVTLSNFDYQPRALRLAAGQPVLLRLVNRSGGGHDFTAPEFFAAAELRPQDRALIAKGGIEVPARQSRAIALVPKAGRYKVKCTHRFHKLFGMTGEIVVG